MIKFSFLIVWIILFTVSFCETIDDKELQKSKQIKHHEDFNSNIKFLIECYGCNPTVEELFLYSRVKKAEIANNIQNFGVSDEVDIDQIRTRMTNQNADNPFFKYEFLNPWKTQTSRFRRSPVRNYPNWSQGNPNGYRHTAPRNVKPGHQF